MGQQGLGSAGVREGSTSTTRTEETPKAVGTARNTARRNEDMKKRENKRRYNCGVESDRASIEDELTPLTVVKQ